MTVAPVNISQISKGRRLVKAFASRSLVPLLMIEACVETGRTYQAYKRGGFMEARERITEEFLSAVFWFTAIPGIDKLLDVTVGKGILKLPKESFGSGQDAARNSIENFIHKYPERFKDPEKAKALLTKYKFGKIAAAVLIANGIIGFAVPKLNQAITRKMRENNQNTQQEQTYSQKPVSMDEFGPKGKNISFGSTQGLLNFVNAFENTPKYQLISEDVGCATGRAISARNKYERREILFRDLSSCFFYMFNMPLLNKLFNKIEHGTSSRLDPVSSKALTDHLVDMVGKDGMAFEQFEKAVLGDKHKIFDKMTSEVSRLLEKDGHIELEKFLEKFKDIDANIARKMSELQPKLKGKSILTEAQVKQILQGGKLNSPEVMHDLYTVATSNDLLFKVKKAVYKSDCEYVAESSLNAVKNDAEVFVKEIIKKAKKSGSKITKEMLEKASKKNFALNAFNWGTGFVVSALFLSTLIPKIQYWLTKRATGSNEFPGTSDEMNKK